jgi:hypothetical protein
MIPAAILGTGAILALMSGSGPRNTVGVKSIRDGNYYQVQNLDNKQDACEYLAKIRENLQRLIDNYQSDPAAMMDPRIQTLVKRFNPENLVENDVNSDSTSYSENKGERIVVCIRDKTPPYDFVDENTVMFVLIHEMAHLMTMSVGHTPEFWTNFKRLLHDSVSIGIYKPVNYSRIPATYCGMTITDTPI